MRIAAQLYTIRDFTKTRDDFVESLRKLKNIGYRQVQLSAVGCMPSEVSASECRSILDDLGISAPLTHHPWDEIKNRTDACIEFHQTIGAELVAIGSIPGEYRAEGLDGYRQFVEDCAEPIRRLEDAGVLFAYHNHAFEFERIDGISPMQVMADANLPGFNFELDTYWVMQGGADLAYWIDLLDGRLPMVHFKDRVVVEGEIRMAPIGEGDLVWASLIPQFVKGGTRLAAVEQDDCYGRDPFECLAASYRYLESYAGQI